MAHVDKNTDLVKSEKNAVSLLQEMCQQRAIRTPEYKVVSSQGPSHRPVFEMEVSFNGRTFRGVGATKQAAKSEAAKKGIEQFSAGQTSERPTLILIDGPSVEGHVSWKPVDILPSGLKRPHPPSEPSSDSPFEPPQYSSTCPRKSLDDLLKELQGGTSSVQTTRTGVGFNCLVSVPAKTSGDPSFPAKSEIMSASSEDVCIHSACKTLFNWLMKLPSVEAHFMRKKSLCSRVLKMPAKVTVAPSSKPVHIPERKTMLFHYKKLMEKMRSANVQAPLNIPRAGVTNDQEALDQLAQMWNLEVVYAPAVKPRPGLVVPMAHGDPAHSVLKICTVKFTNPDSLNLTEPTAKFHGSGSTEDEAVSNCAVHAMKYIYVMYSKLRMGYA